MDYSLIQDFCTTKSLAEDNALSEIRRDTWVNVMYPQMLTEKLQGFFLKELSFLKKPDFILEIGSFTGYSAVCLATGLSEKGKIFCIEANDEMEMRLKTNFAKAGISEKVYLIIGDAMAILPTIEQQFDMIYIDADKAHYPDYLDFAYKLLRPEGIMLADNVFWGGKIVDNETPKTKECRGIANFLTAVENYSWRSRMILPFGDGLWYGAK